MEVRPGYKHTEVGVIPEDWEVKPLGQMLRRHPNYGINAAAIQFDSRYPTYLRITDITEDGNFSEVAKASVNHPSSVAYLLEPGDIVFARTGASVGKSYLYNPSDGCLVFAGFLIRLSPDPERLAPDFLSFFAQSRPYWNWIKVNSMRSGQPGINGQQYARLPIPLPPTLHEQEAIARALRDADALIQSVEQLLAKKRQVKQGAMQELLTGQKRLPGFETETCNKQLPDGWDVRCLRDDILLISGHHVLTQHYNTQAIGVPYLTGPADFPDGYIKQTKFTTKPTTLCEPGDILVTVKGSGSGTLIEADASYCISRQLMAIRVQTWNGRFLFYSLLQNASRIKAASTGLIPGLSRSDILDQPMPLSLNRAEQTAIAAVLSDMDAEIAALEAKLAKARQIKRGMMQELLTGRIRLV